MARSQSRLSSASVDGVYNSVLLSPSVMSSLTASRNELAGVAAGSSSLPQPLANTIQKVSERVCKVSAPQSGTATGFLCVLPFRDARLTGLLTSHRIISQQKLQETDDNKTDFNFSVCFENALCCSSVIPLTRRTDVGRWFAHSEMGITFLELNPETLTKLARNGIEAADTSTTELKERLQIAVIHYAQGGKQMIEYSKIALVQSQNYDEFKHSVSADCGAPVFDVNSWTVIGLQKKTVASSANVGSSNNNASNWAISMKSVVGSISCKFSNSPFCSPTGSGTIRPRTSSTDLQLIRIRQSTVLNEQAKGLICSTMEKLHITADMLVKLNDEEVTKIVANPETSKAVITWRDDQLTRMTASPETFLRMVEEGNMERVSKILQGKPEFLEQVKDSNFDNALNKAAFRGQAKLVEYLVSRVAANVEAPGFCGRTPLMQAAVKGHFPIVKFLIEKGHAEITAKDTTIDQDMAIHLSAYFGHMDVVAYLVSCRPDLLQAKNRTGNTPLTYARRQNKIGVVRFLEAKGARF